MLQATQYGGFCRRDQYCVDAQPLEAAYHKHFKNKYAQADVTFRISSDMEQTSQLQQQTFLNELGHRQLVCTCLSYVLSVYNTVSADLRGAY